MTQSTQLHYPRFALPPPAALKMMDDDRPRSPATEQHNEAWRWKCLTRKGGNTHW